MPRNQDFDHMQAEEEEEEAPLHPTGADNLNKIHHITTGKTVSVFFSNPKFSYETIC